jgi:two-component system sensor kinase FixL
VADVGNLGSFELLEHGERERHIVTVTLELRDHRALFRKQRITVSDVSLCFCEMIQQGLAFHCSALSWPILSVVWIISSVVNTPMSPGPSADSFAQLELRALLDTAVDAVIVIDHHGRVEQFNRAAERMFCFPAEDVIGRDVAMLMPEPHRTHHGEYIERYLRTGEAHIVGIGREVGARRKDGSVFPARLSIGELRTGGASHFVGFVHDLTQAKRAEVNLIEAHRRAQSYLDLAEVILLALDCDGRVTMINRKGCEVLGYTEGELLGQDWIATRVQQGETDAARSVFASFIRGTDPAQHASHESSVIARDGRVRRIAWRSSLLLDDEGVVTGVLSSGEDVTDRRHAEEEVQRSRDRLTHVSRLSTMGEMAGGLAHEINQPLTAISVYAQAGARLLKSETPPDPGELRLVLEQISAQAIRAGEVIRRLRAMVRRRPTERTMIDCNQLVRELIALAEPDARASDVALEVKLADGALPVLVDVVQIQQVLLNLVRNAIDATLAVADAPRRIEIRTAAVADEYVEVSVIDSGCGLPADASERMFEPFFTTKSAGTGLGLSISRGIVRDHGGRLQCAAHEPRGAIFSFTLPLSTE